MRADEDVVAASEVRRLEQRVRDLERMLGRKTLEVEILKEALDLARVKKRLCCRDRKHRRIPRETDRRDLGVARSNLVERVDGKRPKRGPRSAPGMRSSRPISGAWWIAGRAMDTGGSPRSSSASGDAPATIRQRQASLPADEEGRLVAGPAYRAPHPAGP